MGSMCCSDRRVKGIRGKSVLEYMEGEGAVNHTKLTKKSAEKKGLSTVSEDGVEVTNARLDPKDASQLSKFQPYRVPVPDLQTAFLDIEIPPKDPSSQYMTEESKEALPEAISPSIELSSGNRNPSRSEKILAIKKTLRSVDLLNPSQAKNVRNLLQNSRKRNGFELEEAIGIVSCLLLTHVQKEANILITNFAIYWLESERMKTVYLSVGLADLQAVSLTWDLDAMVLHFFEDKVAIQSLFVRNLLMVIECMYYDATGRYLPYRKAAKFASVQSCIDLTDTDLQGMRTFQEACCLEVLMHYGEIGEMGVRLVESTCITAETRRECLFWLTDRAIYTLSRKFQYQFQVPLSEIDGIVGVADEGTVGVQVEDRLVNWVLPLDTVKTLEATIKHSTGQHITPIWTHAAKPSSH